MVESGNTQVDNNCTNIRLMITILLSLRDLQLRILYIWLHVDRGIREATLVARRRGCFYCAITCCYILESDLNSLLAIVSRYCHRLCHRRGQGRDAVILCFEAGKSVVV